MLVPVIVVSGWFALVRQHDGQLVGDVVLQPAPWDQDLALVGWHVGKDGPQPSESAQIVAGPCGLWSTMLYVAVHSEGDKE